MNVLGCPNPKSSEGKEAIATDVPTAQGTTGLTSAKIHIFLNFNFGVLSLCLRRTPKEREGAGEMARWLRALPALEEDLGLIPYPHSSSQPPEIQVPVSLKSFPHLHELLHTQYTCMYTHTQIFKRKSSHWSAPPHWM